MAWPTRDDPFVLDPSNGARHLAAALLHLGERQHAGRLPVQPRVQRPDERRRERLPSVASTSRRWTAGRRGPASLHDRRRPPPGATRTARATIRDYGFQLGIGRGRRRTPVFTVRTRVLAPFAGAEIGGYQSAGSVHRHRGTRDNYIKLVASSRGARGGRGVRGRARGALRGTVEWGCPPTCSAATGSICSWTVDPAAGTVHRVPPDHARWQERCDHAGWWARTALPPLPVGGRERSRLSASSRRRPAVHRSTRPGDFVRRRLRPRGRGTGWRWFGPVGGSGGTTHRPRPRTRRAARSRSRRSTTSARAPTLPLIGWRAGKRGGASGGGSMLATPGHRRALARQGTAARSFATRSSSPRRAPGPCGCAAGGDMGRERRGQGRQRARGAERARCRRGRRWDGFPAGGAGAWSKGPSATGGTATLAVPSAGEHTVEVWMREGRVRARSAGADEVGATTCRAAPVPSAQGWAPTAGASGGSADGQLGGSTGHGVASAKAEPAGDSSGGGGHRFSGERHDRTGRGVSSSGRQSAPSARHEGRRAVATGGKLYLLGGRGQRPVSIFNPATKRWSKGRPRPPFEMHHFQPVAHGSRIYVAGAMTCCYPREGQRRETSWTYTPATGPVGEGERRFQPLAGRGSAAAVVHDDKIYLVGGQHPWSRRWARSAGSTSSTRRAVSGAP